MELPKILLPYQYWDVNFLNETKDNYNAVCPFCENKGSSRANEPRFGVHAKTGAFNCFYCGKQGSVQEFLELWHLHKFKETSENDLRYLTGTQGIPIPASQKFKVAKAGNRYFVPFYNAKLEVSDLKVWRLNKKEFSTKGASVGLFNLRQLATNRDKKIPVYIVPGWRKGIILDWLINRTDNKGIVVGASGENTFRDDFVEFFRDYDVYVVYDNDEAGYGKLDEETGKSEGALKVWVKLKDVVHSIQHVQWPDTFKKSYDIKDFINDNKSDPYSTYKQFRSFFRGFRESENNSIKRTKGIESNGHSSLSDNKISYLQLIEEFRQTYKSDAKFEEAFKVSLATALSVKLPGPSMVWMFLMGPSGCGKTALCEMFKSATRSTLWESSVSKVALCSGWGLGTSLVDNSILAKVDRKTLIINDFTTVLDANENERQQVFSIFRDAYLGYVKRPFGTGERVYNSHFHCLCGVTEVIQKYDNTPVGERFLRYALYGKYDESVSEKAIENELFGSEKKEKIQQSVDLFLQQEFDVDPISLNNKLPKWFREKAIPLSNLCAMFRSGVLRHEKGLKFGQVIYKPSAEVGYRILTQLCKLALALCLLEEKTVIDEEIYEICKKIAIDSMNQDTYKLGKFLVKNPNQQFKGAELAEQLGMRIDSAYLEDLELLKIIAKNKKTDSVPTYTTLKMVNDLWKRSNL